MELAVSLSILYLGLWVDLTKFLSLLMSGAKQEMGEKPRGSPVIAR